MHSADEDQRLARAWLEAVSRAEVRTDLEVIYTSAAESIAARAPACWASGRCCNFEKSGHLLYVTGLETAYTVWMGRAKQCVVAGAQAPTTSLERPGLRPSLYSLKLHVLSNERVPGACPFQVNNLCGVHEIKPLGCRVYFCDKSAQDWQHELSERLLAEIRAIHERHAIEYRYGEWRGMLRMMG